MLASAVGASLSLLIACWSASAAGVAGSSASPSLPLPTPVALPSLPLLAPTATPTPASCPTPLPLPILPTPTACAKVVPSPGPGSTPARSPSSSAALPAGPAGAASSSAAQPGSASTGGVSLASIQSSGLLQLLGLLGTPPNVGVETPTLEHFGNLPSAAAATTPPSPPRSTPSHRLTGARVQLPLALWLATLLGLLSALALFFLGRRAGRPRLSRRAGIATVPLLIALVVGAIATAPGRAGPLVAQRFVGRVASAAVVPVVRVPQPAVEAVSDEATTPGGALLAQLTTFESLVASDESQIGILSGLVASQAPATQQRGPFGDGADPATTIHHVAASLEATLQQEYALLVSAAGDPTQVQGLVQATAGKPAAVRQAVNYDVQAVEAQLAQEAAITRAAQGSPGGGAVAPTTLLAPLDGPITQPFGPTALAFEPAMTFNGVTYPHFHTGIDIAGALDTPVRAAADGVVAIAGAETDSSGRLVGYGNYVVIAHAGRMITLYGHLDQLLVHVGQVVHAGDVIGLEGSSGNSTGPHLHFEVRVADLLTDPTRYLGAQLAAR